MELIIYRSNEGDCLLLRTSDNKHVLIDGGRKQSFIEHTLDDLADLRTKDLPLDLVVVTHVDQDHIEGILALIETEIDWRVHDYQREHNPDPIDEPPHPRPPIITQIWHNSFSLLLGDLTDPATDIINRIARDLRTAPGDELETVPADVVAEWADLAGALATSVPQGAQLSRWVSDDFLGIALNTDFEGDHAIRRTDPIDIGTVTLTVLSPSRANLRDYRKVWRKWIAEHEARAEEIRTRPAPPLGDAAAASEVADLAAFRTLRATLVATAIEGELATRLTANKNARRASVTPQNRASITFLAQEDDRTILFTGDAHQDEIIEGLQAHDLLDGNGKFHCDVLKVQHHGSEFNLDTTFAERVTADTYVLCGDGSHHNPDRSVLKAIIDTRLARDDLPFTLWFNNDPDNAELSDRDRASLDDSVSYVQSRADTHPDRITLETLRRSSGCIALE